MALVVFLGTGLTGLSQTTNTMETGSALAAPSCVAVFVEKGFPTIGGTPSLLPFKMIEVLAQHGIQSQALSAAELSDSTIFNARRFTMGTPSRQWLSITCANFTQRADVLS
jgi:hypothetical protein